MNAFEGLLLGVVQGVTEFLPVSSTGHLIVVRELLGLENTFGLSVDAVLHLATAFAVAVYFRGDLIRLATSLWMGVRGYAIERTDKTLLAALTLGTIPAVAIGLPLERAIETAFRSPTLVAFALIGGSVLFIAAERFSTQTATLTTKKGVAIGFFQALALIPGMSRSGATISGGLLLGLNRTEAARFAFLLSFPIILGAGGKKMMDLGASGFMGDLSFPLLVASFAAFFSGLAAIHFLISFLRTHTLYPFVVYRLALAGIILLFL